MVRVHLKDLDGQPVSCATLKSVLARNRAARITERQLRDHFSIRMEQPRVGGHPSGPSKYLIGPLLPASPVKIEVRCDGHAERTDAINSVPIRPNEIVDMEIILNREVPTFGAIRRVGSDGVVEGLLPVACIDCKPSRAMPTGVWPV